LRSHALVVVHPLEYKRDDPRQTDERCGDGETHDVPWSLVARPKERPVNGSKIA
jgi:hypothetical protein